MEKLSRKLLESDFNFNSDLKIGKKERMPEKIMQFGEGNFLRAFVDYMIDELNTNDLLNGSIVVVQPIEQGMVDMLNDQDGLYTLFARGLENGSEVCDKKIITSISRGINPYTNFSEYIEAVKNPELRFIVSNTTESGIVYNESVKLSDKPQKSFPGKVTALLYERFKTFNGDAQKGFVFIPCELIDNNGTALREIVLRHAAEWELGDDFINWIKDCNVFTNTLVDRIVTGYPRDEVDKLTEELSYKDNLINTSEIFHFWVIEGPSSLSSELPFDKIGLSVVWTDDAKPYKMRKVRILNGAHTMSVLAAYLDGKDTVGELLADKKFYTFLKNGLFDEIIPTLDLDYDNLKTFADAVFDRFANPYIKHYLLSIALNSASKFRARVLPSILEYVKRKFELPKVLCYSFAALIAFYRGEKIEEGALIGKRGDEEYKILDDLNVLEMFKDVWAGCDNTKEAVYTLVTKVCSEKDIWGMDLNTIDGFADAVSDDLYAILTDGSGTALDKIIESGE